MKYSTYDMNHNSKLDHVVYDSKSNLLTIHYSNGKIKDCYNVNFNQWLNFNNSADKENFLKTCIY